jgi:hypothetical protein
LHDDTLRLVKKYQGFVKIISAGSALCISVMARRSTLVAIWALLRVVVVWRDAKHIVALDANAVQQRFRRIDSVFVRRM